MTEWFKDKVGADIMVSTSKEDVFREVNWDILYVDNGKISDVAINYLKANYENPKVCRTIKELKTERDKILPQERFADGHMLELSVRNIVPPLITIDNKGLFLKLNTTGERGGDAPGFS